MPKWDVDRSLELLERTIESNAPGTMVTRCLMDVPTMEHEGLHPKALQVQRGCGMIWCISIGVMQEPKRFFYGHTIREAYLKARKALIKKPVRKLSSAGRKRASGSS